MYVADTVLELKGARSAADMFEKDSFRKNQVAVGVFFYVDISKYINDIASNYTCRWSVLSGGIIYIGKINRRLIRKLQLNL